MGALEFDDDVAISSQTSGVAGVGWLEGVFVAGCVSGVAGVGGSDITVFVAGCTSGVARVGWLGVLVAGCTKMQTIIY